MAGIVVIETITWVPFWYAILFLGCSFICFLVLLSKNTFLDTSPPMKKRKSIMNVRMWLSLDRIILPVLLMTFVLFLIDAFFWTIGPLFAETFRHAGQHGELILAAYTFPGLLVGWLVSHVTERFGKKRTAYVSLFIGSLLLLFIVVAHNYYVALAIVFVASMFLSLALPAVNGVYADLIQEQSNYEEEIETLTDFYTNLGYIIGPMAAGIIADVYGNAASISAVGLFGIIVSVLLMKITPRHINILSKDLITSQDE
jgi:MFS family permease